MALPLGGELPVALKVLRADVMRGGVGANREATKSWLVSSRSSGARQVGQPAGGTPSLNGARSAGDSGASVHPGHPGHPDGQHERASERRNRETEPLHASGANDQYIQYIGQDIGQDIGRDAQFSRAASLSASLEKLSGMSSAASNYSRVLMREAVTAMRFNHNHINLATAYDFGISTAGCCFLVMELVDGPSLRSLRRRPRMPYTCIRRVAVDILDGLSFLHGNGVLHRDISSGNILLSRGGPAKLVDFGLAKQIESTHSGVVRGTVAYASPEALQGSRLDARSDLYSLAAVLYELISGQPPYGSDEPVPTYINMLRTEPDALPSDTPPDLRALVLGLLALEPSERRFATALDALEFLCEHGERVADDCDMGALLSSCVGPSPRATAARDDANAAAPEHDEAIADTLLWVEHDLSEESAIFGRMGGDDHSLLFDGTSSCEAGSVDDRVGLVAETELLGITDAVAGHEALAVGSRTDHGAVGTTQGVAEMFVKASNDASLATDDHNHPSKPRRSGKLAHWVMLLCVAGALGTSSTVQHRDSSGEAALASTSRASYAVAALDVAATRSVDSRCTSPWSGMFWAASCRPSTVTTVVDDTVHSGLASVNVKTSGTPPVPEVDMSATHTTSLREPLQPEAQAGVHDSGGGDEADTQSGAPPRPRNVRQAAGAAKSSSYSVPNFVDISVWTVEDRTIEEPVQP